MCLVGGKPGLDRRPNVYKLEEGALVVQPGSNLSAGSSIPGPVQPAQTLETLPFISVNTLNMSKDFNSKYFGFI